MDNVLRPVSPEERIRPVFQQIEAAWQRDGKPAKRVETVRELIKMLKKLDGDRTIQVAAILPTILVEDNLIFGERLRAGIELRAMDVVVVVDNEREEEDGGAVFIAAG